jgi:hypothetical protein
MPDTQTHCKISKERIKTKDFKELHEWMDESQKYFGENHRTERHTLNDVYLNYVKEKWGNEGVIEWLFHIAIDNLETANKFAIERYGDSNTFKEIKFLFDGKDISSIDFIRFFDNSAKIHRAKLQDNADEKIKTLENKKRFLEE